MATNQLDMATVESAPCFVILKMLKILFASGNPSLEVEVAVALLLHVIRYSIFSNSSIILPRLQALIGVTLAAHSHALLIMYIHIQACVYSTAESWSLMHNLMSDQ